MANPDKPGPKNRREEMYQRLRDALESEEGLDIPEDDDELAQDLMRLEQKMVDLEGNWVLKSKKETKGRSTDCSDAVALTFADKFVRSLRDTSQSVNGAARFLNEGEPKCQRIPHKSVGWMG